MGHGGMRIGPVIISGLDNLYIGFCHGRLFGKFLTQHVERNLQVAVEQPTHQSERKHVTAFQYALVVHARVCQTGFDHLGDRGSNHIVFDAQLFYRVIRRESGLLQIFGLKTIGVDNNTCCRFGISVLGLQCCRIHRHQHITLVARRVHTPRTDVYLKTGNSCQRPLRSPDISRIIGKRTNVISYRRRDRRENIPGQLHTVAGITRETNHYLVQLFYF